MKMKTIKKILTGFITACMVFSAGSVTALAADTLSEANSSGSTTVRYVMDSGWKATIPAYINPSEQGNADTEAYSVTVSDVMLGSSATLVGTVEYDGKLVEANDVELGYVLCDADGEIVTNKEIIYADAGNPDAETAYSFGAELNEKPRYAGNYSGTAAFNFAVNERVFTIGETQPENVIAKFNENYSEVDIFTAGNDSDGIMKDFSGNSPMQAQADKLNAASIEGGVTTIGSQAFNACNKLTSVSIPDTVTSIGSDSFEDCGSLNTIYGSYGSAAEEWAENNSFDFVNSTVYTAEDIEKDEHLFAIGKTKPEYVVAEFNDNFSEVTIFANGNNSDGLMSEKYAYTTDTASPMTKNWETLKKAVIKSGVASIGNYVFSTCHNLTSVVIPDSVTKINAQAFSWCDSLISINIPNSVTNIGFGVFEYCTSLEAVHLSENISAIENNAFYWCHALKNINIPNGVTSIGDNAFNRCYALEEIRIPDKVTSIGKNAFRECSLLNNVVIPNGVTEIQPETFYGCAALQNITIPNSVTTIGYNAFHKCSALKNIQGISGSYAESWANSNGYTFISID